MSPTRNGHHPQHHSTASSSSSTGTIPKVVPPPQPGQTGGISISRMMQQQPGFPLALSADFSSSGAAALANPTSQDLTAASQLGLADVSFAEITEQNLLLRRLRDQQERLRQLQQHQVEMLHWQESESAAVAADLNGRRAASAAAAPGSSSSSRRSMDHRDGVDLRASYLEGMLGRMEQLPNPQQISDNLEQLQQRISFLRLLDAEANIVQTESHQQMSASGDLEAQKLDLMKKLADLEAKKLRMDKSLRHTGRSGEQQQPQQRSRSSNSSKTEEMWLLKERLRDLQHMVEAMEEGPTSPAPSSSYEKPKATQQINATDHLLAEMQEQLKLQKDLHLRRKELEDLMRKDLLESMRKNEQGQNLPGWYAEAALAGLPANHYQVRSRQMSDSSGSRSNLGLPMATTPASTTATDKQLRDLQTLVDNMQCEIRRLNASSGSNHYCQRQFQELSHSVNQCLQAMLCLQRDVSCLHREVEKLMRQRGGQGEDSGLSVSRPSETLEEGGVFNPWPVVPDMGGGMAGVFEAADAWLQNVPSSDGGGGGEGVGDAWGAMGIGANSLSHHLNETSSVVALNNQVLPGMRANNYWDNFRSFSRQNRLSNVSSSSSSHFHPLAASVFVASPSVVSVTATTAVSHGAAAAAAAPNVAQVTPRQLQSTPNSLIMEQPSHPRARQASVEPNFVSINSPPRPRRKQKINREQNRELFSENGQAQSSPNRGGISGLNRAADQPSGVGHHATAAMVFPMPQNQDRNVNRDTPPPFNLATVNPVVGSLTRSIYNQVNNLISQHEGRPDQLERIFHNLQSLDNRLVSRLDPSVFRGQRPFLEESPIQDQNCELSNNAPKVRTDKRFHFPRAEGDASSFFAAANGAGGGHPLMLATGQRPSAAEQFPSIHNSLNRQEQADNQGNGAAAAAASAAADRNDVVGAEGFSGAVPKNVQWNLKSQQQQQHTEESKAPLYLREMPKNMQEQFDHCLPETDMLNNASFFNNEQDFINIDIGFGSSFRGDDNRPAQALVIDEQREPQDQEDAEDEEEEEEEESEIPEADQGHSPEHPLQAHFLGAAGRHHSREESEEVTAAAAAAAAATTQGENEPADAEGSNNDCEDDRVTLAEDRGAGARISVASAALLEHQMMEEEASMRSLVDEVLDDSSDSSSVAADESVQKPS